MRQMPSVTVTTVPTLRASLADLKFSIRGLDEVGDFGCFDGHVPLSLT